MGAVLAHTQHMMQQRQRKQGPPKARPNAPPPRVKQGTPPPQAEKGAAEEADEALKKAVSAEEAVVVLDVADMVEVLEHLQPQLLLLHKGSR